MGNMLQCSLCEYSIWPDEIVRHIHNDPCHADCYDEYVEWCEKAAEENAQRIAAAAEESRD